MNTDVAAIEARIEAAIFEHDMLKNTKTVIIGVSGGADSMALLKFFEGYSKKHGLNIVAAHVNHCLRGDESIRDENFVRAYCEKHEIKLEILRIDVKKIAATSKKSVEECARQARYDFFYELSARNDGKIATAHTLSDSAETMLINLARGTGAAGLCGIPAKRGKVIRPLIALKRAETQQYCEANGIAYVTDSSNLSRDYTRNKIRLDVIPVLKEINAEFECAVARTAEFLRADNDYLNKVATKFLQKSFISAGIYNLKEVYSQPLPILSRFVKLAVFEVLKSNVTAQHIDLILNLVKSGYGAVILPQKVKVSVKNEILTVKKADNSLTPVKNTCEIPFNAGCFEFGNSAKITVEILDKKDFIKFENFNDLLFFYALDCDTINVDSVFRTRKAGDAFCQAGRGVTKSVKKLFNELKIAPDNRDEVLMLADKNEVLWINNVGISERVKVTEKTQKIAVIYSRKEI